MNEVSDFLYSRDNFAQLPQPQPGALESPEDRDHLAPQENQDAQDKMVRGLVIHESILKTLSIRKDFMLMYA